MSEEELFGEIFRMRFRRPDALEDDLVLGFTAGAARRPRRDAVDVRLGTRGPEMLVLVLPRPLPASGGRVGG